MKANSGWGWFGSTLKSMGKSDLVGRAIEGEVGAALSAAVSGACYASAGREIVALAEHIGIW
ncbi:MAG: hypothetical protein GX102_02075 [Porphyromonadaceae bacterium]|jgi:hypothetical protein|nr:hypothetical protein [Porphyromonadaceae bacterium]